MQVPLQITLRNIPASPALTEKIRDRVAKLEALGRRLVSCAVTVDAPHRHSQQGREFTVRIDLRVPGREIAVTRDHHEDVYVALHDAFDVAVRETDERTQVVRGRVKAHAKAQGTVV
jgi:ribosomal subunit interface protein